MANRADIDRAHQGKNHWNAWAQQNLGAKVSFTNMGKLGVEGSLPSLEGFIFPGEVDFSGSILSSGPKFAGCIFQGPAFFRLVKFKFRPDFRCAIFQNTADFHGASFIHGPVCFSGSQFLGKFSISVDLNGRGDKIIPEIIFRGCKFYNEAKFSNRIFGDVTNFQSAKFHGLPIFHGASLHQGTIFGDIDNSFTDFLSSGAEQSYRTLKLAMGEQQARTEEAAFAALELKARRYRLKSESKKRKLENARKKNLEKEKKKKLEEAIKKNRGEVIEKSFVERIKEKFGETRKKKFGLQRLWNLAERCFYCLWEIFSNSGRGFLRPLTLYFAFWVVFAAFYVLLPACKMQPPLCVLISQGRNWGTGFRYSFLKQFSFGEIFRGNSSSISELEAKLFCLNGAVLTPGWVDVLNSLQSIISFALIFLMGLGIRHKFRLR